MRSLKLPFLYACKAVGLFYLARWLTRGHLKILCYHGFEIADEARFRPKLFIRPDEFEKRLAAIRRYGFRVLPLHEAITRLYSRSLPANALAITIDDGFHSVYRLAAPALERYRIPATVYVTTYYVEYNHPIFRLVVQYMFWKTKNRTLVLKGRPWCADRMLDLSDAAQTEKAMWDCINYGEQQCSEDERCRICDEVGDLLGVPYGDIVQSRILDLMTPAELQALAHAKIDIQLHTHRHVFPSDRRESAQREITDNRRALKQWITTNTEHFCYPSGLWHKEQWAWLDDMHVKSSTTCLPGLNSHKTPRHALRRFLDGANIHQLEFEASLSGFSDLLRGARGMLGR